MFLTKFHEPVISLQAEPADCGLVAISCLSAMYGRPLSQSLLKDYIGNTLRGLQLKTIRDLLRAADFGAEAVSLEPASEVGNTSPCIALWNNNHFVVLGRSRNGKRRVFDPALGWRWLAAEEIRRGLSGFGVVITSVPTTSRFAQKKVFSPFAWLSEFNILNRLWPLMLTLAGMQAATALLPGVTGNIVDNATGATPGAAENELIIFLLLSAFAWLFTVWSSWTQTRVSARLTQELTISVVRKTLRKPLRFLARFTPEALSAKLSAVDIVQGVVSGEFVATITYGIIGAIAMVLLFAASPLIALFCVASAVLKAAIDFFMHANLTSATEKSFQNAVAFRSSLQGFLRVSAPLRRYQAHDAAIKIVSKKIQESTASIVDLAKYEQFQRATHNGINIMDRAFYVLLGAYLVDTSTLTAGAFIAIGMYREMVVSSLESVRALMKETRLAFASSRKLEDILEDDECSHRENVSIASDGIVFRAVTFAYQRFTRPILQDFSLHIRKGECVAITGTSGCGKSTLAKLLICSLQPDAGAVYVNGIDVHGPCGSSVLNRIGSVMQDDMLIPGSVYENIDMFRGHSKMEIETAARFAEIHDMIIYMPMGYETLVNDATPALSGGQRQRVLLARALCGAPDVIIMDESTSHLDIATEKQIAANISQLQGITRVIIAHREETVRGADRVIDLSACAVEHKRPSTVGLAVI